MPKDHKSSRNTSDRSYFILLQSFWPRGPKIVPNGQDCILPCPELQIMSVFLDLRGFENLSGLSS